MHDDRTQLSTGCGDSVRGRPEPRREMFSRYDKRRRVWPKVHEEVGQEAKEKENFLRGSILHERFICPAHDEENDGECAETQELNACPSPDVNEEEGNDESWNLTTKNEAEVCDY